MDTGRLKRFTTEARNKNIATAFFKAGYVEAWGRGYKKVKEALESVNLSFPKVENFCGGTLVTIQRLALNPTITIPEMSEKISGKNSFTTRTIQRDIAYLQNHDILKREGGRKEGRWVVLRSLATSVS